MEIKIRVPRLHNTNEVCKGLEAHIGQNFQNKHVVKMNNGLLIQTSEKDLQSGYRISFDNEVSSITFGETVELARQSRDGFYYVIPESFETISQNTTTGTAGKLLSLVPTKEQVSTLNMILASKNNPEKQLEDFMKSIQEKINSGKMSKTARDLLLMRADEKGDTPLQKVLNAQSSALLQTFINILKKIFNPSATYNLLGASNDPRLDNFKKFCETSMYGGALNPEHVNYFEIYKYHEPLVKQSLESPALSGYANYGKQAFMPPPSSHLVSGETSLKADLPSCFKQGKT